MNRVRKPVKKPFPTAKPFEGNRRRFQLYQAPSKAVFSSFLRSKKHGEELAGDFFRFQTLFSDEADPVFTSIKGVRRGRTIGVTTHRGDGHDFAHVVEHGLLKRIGIRRNDEGMLGDLFEAYIELYEQMRPGNEFPFHVKTSSLEKPLSVIRGYQFRGDIVREQGVEDIGLRLFSHFPTHHERTALLVAMVRNPVIRSTLKTLNEISFIQYDNNELSPRDKLRARRSLFKLIRFAQAYRKRLDKLKQKVT